MDFTNHKLNFAPMAVIIGDYTCKPHTSPLDAGDIPLKVQLNILANIP